jgi:hypothetical protein
MNRRDYVIVLLLMIGMVVGSAGLVWIAFFAQN